MASTLQELRGVVNRSADANVGCAAAEVAGHGEIDVVVVWPLDFLEQSGRGHYLPRLTVPALRDIMGDPCSLDRVGLATGQSLDGRDLAGADAGHRHRAGTQWLTIEINRSGTALRHPAAELGPGQAKIVPQHPKQGSVGQYVNGVGLAVDLDLQSRHRAFSFHDNPPP